MTHDVFISYSNNDKPIADGICANLETAGIRCWIAPRDIAPEQDWRALNINAIEVSCILVVIYSSNSNPISEVRRELSLAGEYRMEIIWFAINRETSWGHFPPRYRFDTTNPPSQDQIQHLVDCVKTITKHREEIGEMVRHKLTEAERNCCTRVWESLTLRQREVLQAFAEGLSRREAAQSLGLSIATVDKHCDSILRQCKLVWEEQNVEEFDTEFIQRYFGPFLAGSEQTFWDVISD